VKANAQELCLLWLPINKYMLPKDDFCDGLCCVAGFGYNNIDVQNKDGSWRSAVSGSKFSGVISYMIGEDEHHLSCFKHVELVSV
jgi:hypothetical protein